MMTVIADAILAVLRRIFQAVRDGLYLAIGLWNSIEQLLLFLLNDFES